MGVKIQQSSIGGPWETLAPNGNNPESLERAREIVKSLRDYWAGYRLGPSFVDFQIVDTETGEVL